MTHQPIGGSVNTLMNYFFSTIRFLFLSLLKVYSTIFYKLELIALDGSESIEWHKAKLVMLLNHTSLWEPLYVRSFTVGFTWKVSCHLVYPGADSTLNRPLIGILFKLMAPKAISISRKRDESWDQFMKEVKNQSVVIMFPEGRMKRANGLDKDGKPMTVRGGFYDVLQCVDDGEIIFLYSGGMHHVQVPGQHLPKLFKTLKLAYQHIPVKDYKKLFAGEDAKQRMIRDLEQRRDRNCPRADDTPWHTTV